MRGWVVGVVALALAGCTTPQIQSAHQDAEKAVIEADYLYAAIAQFANAQEASGAWDAVKGEGLKVKAYDALLQARHAYDVGSSVDLSALTSLASANNVPVTGG